MEFRGDVLFDGADGCGLRVHRKTRHPSGRHAHWQGSLQGRLAHTAVEFGDVEGLALRHAQRIFGVGAISKTVLFFWHKPHNVPLHAVVAAAGGMGASHGCALVAEKEEEARVPGGSSANNRVMKHFRRSMYHYIKRAHRRAEHVPAELGHFGYWPG
jgi:hypothetical protein